MSFWFDKRIQLGQNTNEKKDNTMGLSWTKLSSSWGHSSQINLTDILIFTFGHFKYSENKSLNEKGKQA